MVLRKQDDWQVVDADYRHGEWELVERQERRPKNSISIRKDRKGRLAMVRSLR
jgi:hypothetical protein